MHFVVLCTDKADHLPVRLGNRPTHLAWLEANRLSIPVAGPFLGPDGQSPIGSMLIVDCPDADSARALVAEDPYAKAGLFAATEIRPWRWTIGAPKAGA